MDQKQPTLEQIASFIKNNHHIVLSTHRQCDGDGLGCELALYFALKKIGKNVKIINIDRTPKKYQFLHPDLHIQYFEDHPILPNIIDLVLIFDTNDHRLVEPLFSHFIKQTQKIIFIDHHPLLQKGPQPNKDSYINIEAASTGELVYNLIQLLNIPFDNQIAQALYTSVTFDTQLYRFIRNSPKSHLIAADLLNYNINPEIVHRHLFSHQTVDKISFMAKVFGNIEYFANGILAYVILEKKDLDQHGLTYDEVRDITDQIMSIDSIEIALVIRQDSDTQFKVSLRSKGIVEVLSAAESIGGGGHWYAAGGTYQGKLPDLKFHLINHLINSLNNKQKVQSL